MNEPTVDGYTDALKTATKLPGIPDPGKAVVIEPLSPEEYAREEAEIRGLGATAVEGTLEESEVTDGGKSGTDGYRSPLRIAVATVSEANDLDPEEASMFHHDSPAVRRKQHQDANGSGGPTYEQNQGDPDADPSGSTDPHNSLSFADSGDATAG